MFILVIILIVQTVDARFAGKIYPSRCLGSEPFMLLHKKSPQDCQIECAERQHCLAVSYQRNPQLCRLYDVLTSLSRCAGYVVILKSDFLTDNINVCSGSCPVTDCNHIPSINNAETFGNLLHVGSVVKVKCSDDGSESYIECQPNGQWTQQPTCSATVISCGTPVSVANSVESYSSTFVGSVTSYTCVSGYTASPISASMSVTCLANGQWETIGLTCEQVDCGTPLTVANSQRTYTSTTVGSVVTYTCNSGYTSSPTTAAMSFTCLDTGQWESITFACQQVDCGTPSIVANSQRTFTSTTPGSIVTYTCNSGYTSLPTSAAMSFTCLDTGQWESISFTCQQVDCGSPSTIANSQRTFTSTTPGSIVTYTCNSGYTSSPTTAAMSFTCLDTGQWESISFACQQVDCGTPSIVANSQRTFTTTTLGSIVTYTCNSGYTSSPTTAAMSFTCLATGQWESISFTCQQVDCGTPSTAANSQRTFTSTTPGSIVTYTCNSGYTSSPTTAAMSLSCLGNGQWESISFTCQQVDCGTPSTVANSQRTFTSTTPGSIVTYTCNSGYTSSPTTAAMSLTCFASGQWESISFTCQQVDCGTPSTVANSQRTYTTTTAGSTVTFTCNSGYNPSPASATTSFICLNSGQWEAISFSCVIDCGIPPTIANGQSTYTTTNAGSSAAYNCNSGHVGLPASAAMSITCQQSGDWETVSFTCTASVPVGSSCSQDSDCVDPAARCLDTGYWSAGKRCFCKPLYEFNQSQAVCTKVCNSYTSLEKYSGEYFREHNVGDSGGDRLTEAECLQFCEDNYADSYLSVDHWHARNSGTNCYCGSMTRQQALDASPDLHRVNSNFNMFTKSCA
ncbi:sushi, von Willebrand factor type A, EGF and pentraxin domain-containing protein 1-like [Mercenaria mercenaria]|uniref:sushi, von Willebrand factor type A, EGF and pentraxin domain-containing protein 1-like n=1 Tax=Mercenaria mercenaria TaxID=6596 RepID=UPI00234F4F0C|nr:sushi, von Willebrand factor type A, EGF and pentraxin domain-containing protein 1-like [Mercenaria mercenaria]